MPAPTGPEPIETIFIMNIGSQFRSIPPVTKNIIIINFIVWIVEMIIPRFGDVIINKLGLHLISADLFNPTQLITYMFVHSNSSIVHILFNMFTLFMFGPLLERVWGSRRYFVFYMVCGIGAALVQEAVWALTWKHEFISALGVANGYTFQSMQAIVNEAIAEGNGQMLHFIADFKNEFVTVGASGAIFGLLLGFAFVFPNMPLYLFFIPIPIKAKYMVIGYAVIELYLGVSGGGTIAHFAHLGGMIFGLILLLYWKKKGELHGNGFY